MSTQTEAQFKMLYGKEIKWAATTKAGFAVLFRDSERRDAGSEYGVSDQAIHAFLGRNESKHYKKLGQLQEATEYAALGK